MTVISVQVSVTKYSNTTLTSCAPSDQYNYSHDKTLTILNQHSKFLAKPLVQAD